VQGIYPAEKVECILKCPYCNEEIADEGATFCPHCGKSLTMHIRRTDLVLVASVLTIIAAAFAAGLGYNAIYNYTQYIAFYPDVQTEFLGFLIFGIPDIVASAIAIAGAILMLKRKSIVISMLGVIIPLASAVLTFMTIYLVMPVAAQGALFTETTLLAEISIIIFSIISVVLVLKSKSEFAQG
jgi:hypothetical protein